MERGKTIWAADDDDVSNASAIETKFVAVEKLDNVLKEAKASQRRETSLSTTLRTHGREPCNVRKIKSATAADVDAWLHELRHRRRPDDPSKSFCNDEQFQAIETIAHRVKAGTFTRS